MPCVSVPMCLQFPPPDLPFPQLLHSSWPSEMSPSLLPFYPSGKLISLAFVSSVYFANTSLMVLSTFFFMLFSCTLICPHYVLSYPHLDGKCLEGCQWASIISVYPTVASTTHNKKPKGVCRNTEHVPICFADLASQSEARMACPVIRFRQHGLIRLLKAAPHPSLPCAN